MGPLSFVDLYFTSFQPIYRQCPRLTNSLRHCPLLATENHLLRLRPSASVQRPYPSAGSVGEAPFHRREHPSRGAPALALAPAFYLSIKAGAEHELKLPYRAELFYSPGS